ncbi:MAG: RecQ family ATP-dependent DNA helicase [Muribaculaceae bacterium]|nr:RecQ family ATP-dependent DNA helicase [Muribaculaceae bacterium]
MRLIEPDILGILGRYWGYGSFRPMQREIIDSVLAGRDTLGLLPTGGGKSITFQVPAMAVDGLTVVVTPLISLMKDQADNLAERGIRAFYLHSGMSQRESRLAFDKCRLGKAKILYLSPERLQNQRFRAQLRQLPVALIVVDEAHCISQWGHDFRPSYLRIAELREAFPEAPVLALTASATPQVVADIMRSLGFRKPHGEFRLSFTRKNISYIVRHCDFKEQQLLRVLAGVPGTAIVYTRSRRRTREVAEFLKTNGISADYYHAGLLPEEKEARQNSWKGGRTRVMVATNAFGMGIDKPDVRAVVHVDLPSSLEEYYQEAGRAGRDGKPSFAVILATKADRRILSKRLSDSFPAKDYIRDTYHKLCVWFDVAMGEGEGMVREFDLSAYCERFKASAAMTRSALTILSRSGYIDYVEEPHTRSRLIMAVDRRALYDLELDRVADDLLQAVLRTYTGIFADFEYIDEARLAARTGTDIGVVYETLVRLGKMRVINFVPHRSTPIVVFQQPRQPQADVVLPKEVYENRRRQMELRVEAMKRFVFNDGECRVGGMLRYFGEEGAAECGTCDVCRARQPRGPQAVSNDEADRIILHIVSQLPQGRPISYIGQAGGIPRDQLLDRLRVLADEGRVVLTPDFCVVAKKD